MSDDVAGDGGEHHGVAEPDGWRPWQTALVSSMTGALFMAPIAAALSSMLTKWSYLASLLPGYVYAVMVLLAGNYGEYRRAKRRLARRQQDRGPSA